VVDGDDVVPPPQTPRSSAATHTTATTATAVQRACARVCVKGDAAHARTLLGVGYLVCIACIWVASSVVVQQLFKFSNPRPTFLTYAGNNMLSLLLAYQAAQAHCGRRPPIPWKAAAKAAVAVFPAWAAAQLAYNASLAATSVSNSTILASTSSAFTFILALLVLRERFLWVKAAGVVATITGAVIVALLSPPASAQQPSKWWGNVVAILSSMLYAVYATIMRRVLPEDGPVSVQLFVGCLGVCNALFLAPVVVALHCTRVEPLNGMPATDVLIIMGKGVVDNLLTGLMWAKAVQLTSTTVATVALSLTIPLAMFSDWMVYASAPAVWTIVGAVAVLCGFLAVVYGDRQLARESAAAAAAAAEVVTGAPDTNGARLLSPA
ncbi:DMT family transporter, partial [archaeon]